MKKFVVLICAAVTILFGAIACADEADIIDTAESETNVSAKAEGLADGAVIACSAQYIRTDGGEEEESYPQYLVVESRAELDAYIMMHEDQYALGPRKEVTADSTIGFADAIVGYDEAFFEKNALVLVLLEEGSGSNRHKVQGITEEGEILIECIIPEVGTCDMAYWHIILELPKDLSVLARPLQVTFMHEEGWIPPPVVATYASRHASVQVTLPGEGWNWEEIPDAGGDEPFGIRFWPEEDKNAAVDLCCYPAMLGVCGTGLTIQKLILDNGETASVFIYDDTPWFLISFDKTAGWYYAMKNSNAGDAYDEELLEILRSVVLGQGNADYDKIISIAAEESGIPYDYANACFDINTGFWRVCLGKNGQAGGDTEVIINDIGGIETIIYGE